jgi:hypothetical protein
MKNEIKIGTTGVLLDDDSRPPILVKLCWIDTENSGRGHFVALAKGPLQIYKAPMSIFWPLIDAEHAPN